MARRTRHHYAHEELNIWPAFTDLMSNAFMILMLFLLVAILKSVFFRSASQATGNQVTQLYERIASLQKNLQQKTKQVQELEQQINRLKSPPLIVIKDSAERNFKLGSAELSPGLRTFIETDLVKQIEGYAQEYNGYVVEVIGHTDGKPNTRSSSNLDEKLETVANGTEPVSNLKPGSNADLGLMRALAVVKQLQNTQRSNKDSLQGLKFRAYSAAQLFLPTGDYAPINNSSPDQTRRRIEIRFTPPAIQQ